jgi:predicted XRE-type DNA-binding protein
VSHLTLVPEPETIEPVTHEVAVRIDTSLRKAVRVVDKNLEVMYRFVRAAKLGDVHKALGFKSWPAYIADVLTVRVRLEPEQRRELVGYLSGEGMSQRTIAEVLGVSQKTVDRDLDAAGESNDSGGVTGRDGKTYKRKPKPAAKPAVKIEPGDLTREEAVEITGRIRDWVTARPDPEEVLRQIREPERSGASQYSKDIQRLSAAIAENCAALTDKQIAEALGAAQFLYEFLRGETVLRGTV